MEKYKAIEIAAITGISIGVVRGGLREYLGEERLPRNASFDYKEIDTALEGVHTPSATFRFKLRCAKDILHSQERAGVLFDNAFGIKNLKFPPSLSVYERLLTEHQLKKIKESWKRKHQHLYTDMNPTIK